MISTRKKILSFVLTAVALLVLFIFAVNTGSLKVTPSELFSGLFIEYNPDVATIYDLRFPRIFIAMLGDTAVAAPPSIAMKILGNLRS